MTGPLNRVNIPRMRSPLSRKALGGRCAAIALTVLCVSCMSARDRFVRTGRSTSSYGCGRQPSQLGKAELQVVVYGSAGSSVNEASVQVVRDEEAGGMHLSLPFRPRPVMNCELTGYVAESALPYGSWEVLVGLPFEEPAVRRKVYLRPNDLCVIQVFLRTHS